MGTGFQEDVSACECLVWGLEKLVQEAQEKAFDYKSQRVGELELGRGGMKVGKKTTNRRALSRPRRVLSIPVTLLIGFPRTLLLFINANIFGR